VEAAEPGRKPMLFMIASNSQLDLKKVAKAIGVKKAHMARHADAERMTGLKVGGISALALLNRGFDIYIDEWIEVLDFVLVSAGQRGINLRMAAEDLLRATSPKIVDVSAE
jgi:Cys-tRNA(Pro)/Cys-tRNA(Cys) deacylase